MQYPFLCKVWQRFGLAVEEVVQQERSEQSPIIQMRTTKAQYRVLPLATGALWSNPFCEPLVAWMSMMTPIPWAAPAGVTMAQR